MWSMSIYWLVRKKIDIYRREIVKKARDGKLVYCMFDL